MSKRVRIRRHGPVAYTSCDLDAATEEALRSQFCIVDPLDFNKVNYFYEDGVMMRGIVHEVKAALIERGYDAKVIKPSYGDKDFDWEFKGCYREGQRECVEALLHCYEGVVEAPPGFGKTVVLSAVTAALGKRTLVMAEAMLPITQAYNTIISMTNITPGMIAEGRLDIDEVCVATVQNLYKAFDREDREELFEWLRGVKVLFVDEAHHMPNMTYMRVVQELDSLERIYGLTATPDRDDGRSTLLHALLGPVVFSQSYGKQVEVGNNVPLTVITEDCAPWDYGLAAKSARLNQNARRKNYKHVYDDYVVYGSHGRNLQIAEFTNSAVRQGKTVVVIVDRIPHALELAKLIPGSEVLTGNREVTPKKTIESIVDRLQHRELKVVISTLMNEAVDVRSLDVVVLASGGKSTVKTRQRLRCTRSFEGMLRTGYYKKKRGYVYLPVDKTDFLGRHVYTTKKVLRDLVNQHPQNNMVDITKNGSYTYLE